MTQIENDNHVIDHGATQLDWSPKDDTTHAIRARRNVLIGFWAGNCLGLSGDDLSRYACAMHMADYRLSGDQDLVEKMQKDFVAKGQFISEIDIHRVLRSFHRQALQESSCTD